MFELWLWELIRLHSPLQDLMKYRKKQYLIRGSRGLCTIRIVKFMSRERNQLRSTGASISFVFDVRIQLQLMIVASL